MGFYEGKVQVDELWIYDSCKIIQKIYTFLLDYNLDDKRVKTMMIKWAQKFGYNIDIDGWTQMWNENYR